MSIPEWSYAEAHYDGLLEGKGVEIRTHPVKGKGLFATAAFEKGDVIFEERAVCCTQFLDEFNAGVPICSHCLTSLETPADIVERVGGKDLAAELPLVSSYVPRARVPCRSVGCKSIYCSQDCEVAAWDRQHALLCEGALAPTAQKAVRRFHESNWQSGRIDFSDPHYLSLKAVAAALKKHRDTGMPLDVCFRFVDQLARAPLSRFKLTCLVRAEYDEEALGITAESEPLDVARARHWTHFSKYRDVTPLDADPIVAWSFATGEQSNLVDTAVELIYQMFEMSDAEKAFFTKNRWSETIGATLMNAHRRIPNAFSPYADYLALAKEGHAGEIAQFHKKLRSADVDPRSLDSYSHGLGFFVVGACMNHSCSPNVLVCHQSHRNETLCLKALRRIEVGEELFISYIEESDHVFTRLQHLFEQYLFPCDCPRCAEELQTETARLGLVNS